MHVINTSLAALHLLTLPSLLSICHSSWHFPYFFHIFPNLQHWSPVLYMPIYKPVPKAHFWDWADFWASASVPRVVLSQPAGRAGCSARVPPASTSPRTSHQASSQKVPAIWDAQLLSARSVACQRPASFSVALTHPAPPSRLPFQLLATSTVDILTFLVRLLRHLLTTAYVSAPKGCQSLALLRFQLL